MTLSSVEELFWLLGAAALLSSALTLLVAGLAVHFWIRPRMERHIDEKIQRAAESLEERFRTRFLEMLGGRSGEVIRERARDLARTGMGILSGRRPADRRYDEDDFSD